MQISKIPPKIYFIELNRSYTIVLWPKFPKRLDKNDIQHQIQSQFLATSHLWKINIIDSPNCECDNASAW